TVAVRPVEPLAAGGVSEPRVAGPRAVRATGTAAVRADLERLTRDARGPDALARLRRQRRGQLDERERGEDLDLADVGAVQAALACQRADDRVGASAVVAADVDAVDVAPRAAVLAAAGGVPVRLSGVVATLGRATRGARGGVLDEPGLLGARRVLVAGLRSSVADTERQQRGRDVERVAAVLGEHDRDPLAVQLEATALEPGRELGEQRVGAVGADVGGRRDRDLGERRARRLLDRAQAVPLLGGEERERGAGATGAAGATDAVHIGLGLARHVEVDDEADPV